MKIIEELIDMLFDGMSDKLSSDELIAYILTRDVICILRKLNIKQLFRMMKLNKILLKIKIIFSTIGLL